MVWLKTDEREVLRDVPKWRLKGSLLKERKMLEINDLGSSIGTVGYY